MYSSQTPLPTHIGAAQASLFHAIQVAEHTPPADDDDEDDVSYQPMPMPSSSGEQPVRREKSPSSPGRDHGEEEVLSPNHSVGSPHSLASSLPAPQSMSTLLALSAQPELKNLENGSSGATGEAADEDEKKQRDREHKKRSKNWTRPETLHLIRLRAQLEPRFAKSGRKTELWDEIAEGLQREQITRDAQQCRDKWEKLTAGYKEVRDGVKDREDNPFYDELHPLLSGKPMKRERERERDEYAPKDTVVREVPKELTQEAPREGGLKEHIDPSRKGETFEEEDDADALAPARKKKRGAKYISVTDVAAVQSVLETIISRQQKFFRDLLDSMERKEQRREQMRQEKEDKWRAEERAQRGVFNNAMIILTQKLVGEHIGVGLTTTPVPTAPPTVGSPEGPQGGPKRRSKNWKRAEVLQLIKLRGEMEGRFAKSTRRAALWDELAELLLVQGIKRDGKQCREKWDKLMAEYKDVADGKRDQRESPYYAELTAILGRPAEAG